jgi:hypothetical protein
MGFIECARQLSLARAARTGLYLSITVSRYDSDKTFYDNAATFYDNTTFEGGGEYVNRAANQPPLGDVACAAHAQYPPTPPISQCRHILDM